jgi:hypothetical protein
VSADIESMKLDIEMHREWGGKLRALMAKQLTFNKQLDQSIYDAKATTKAKQVEKAEHMRHQQFVRTRRTPNTIPTAQSFIGRERVELLLAVTSHQDCENTRVWKAASSKAEPTQKQDWILKCVQGG